jgi:hypothetical protein
MIVIDSTVVFDIEANGIRGINIGQANTLGVWSQLFEVEDEDGHFKILLRYSFIYLCTSNDHIQYL